MPTNKGSRSDALNEVYAEQGGCGGWFLLVIAGVIWIIPVVGWIAAPLAFIMGIISLMAPQTFERVFSQSQYESNIAKSLLLLQNTYQSATCPCCNYRIEALVWQNPGGLAACPQCATSLARQDDLLFYIPKPDAVVSHDLRALFPELTGDISEVAKALPRNAEEA